MGEGEQFFVILPHMDLFQRIGPQNEKSLIRAAPQERAQCVDGVRRTFLGDLDIRDFKELIPITGFAGHFETVVGGNDFSRIFVWGCKSRYENDTVQIVIAGDFFRQTKMSQMRRIKGSAQESDFQDTTMF
jgi:hypothetical protein